MYQGRRLRSWVTDEQVSGMEYYLAHFGGELPKEYDEWFEDARAPVSSVKPEGGGNVSAGMDRNPSKPAPPIAETIEQIMERERAKSEHTGGAGQPGEEAPKGATYDDVPF